MSRKVTKLGAPAMAASVAALTVVPAGSSADAKRVVTLRAPLSAAEVVPPPGDPDGLGSARLTISGTRLCWRMQVRRIQRPHSAHIHAAPRGREGPAVVPLFLDPTSLERPKRGCVTAPRLFARDIARHPGRYYINVHNEEFENGAVRGQLSRVRRPSRRRSPSQRREVRFAG